MQDVALTSAKLAYDELTSLWDHLPKEWGVASLAQIHRRSRKDVVALMQRKRGLAELVHRLFENGLVHCTCDHDFGEMPMPTNLSSLFTLLIGDYAESLDEPEPARKHLDHVLDRSVNVLVEAAHEQIQSLKTLVERVLATLARLALSGGRVVLLELPVGNSIACKLLASALKHAGYTVAHVRVSLPRNESRNRGVRRVDVLEERLKAFSLRDNDLILYVDEWQGGSNFAAVCAAIDQCLRAHTTSFCLPIGLLTETSHKCVRYGSFVEKHNSRLKLFSAAPSNFRIVVPPIKTRFGQRSYFFWSEHDRTSGYRKMQFLGSLYSSFDGAVEELHDDPEQLRQAMEELLSDSLSSGKEPPSDMRTGEQVWAQLFDEGYRDWVARRPALQKLEHSSNLADVENVEASLQEVLAAIHSVVSGHPAERALKVAAHHHRRRMRVPVDPVDRYHFKNHAAVVTELKGSLALFHSKLMVQLYRLVVTSLETTHPPTR